MSHRIPKTETAIKQITRIFNSLSLEDQCKVAEALVTIEWSYYDNGEEWEDRRAGARINVTFLDHNLPEVDTDYL